MTLASLPTLSVQIAFNPTDINSLTQTWTDVSSYVRDYQTRSGKQHYLDRIEAATLQMTVDNRTGFFLNGGSSPGNGTGYVIQPRLPIKVTQTWSATTYNVFYGIIDNVTERIGDYLNTDLVIQATDRTKQLSLRYMTNLSLYSTYAKSATATNWYRCSLDTSNTTLLPDQIGTNNGTWNSKSGTVQASAVAYPNYGALIYDTDTCADLTNGTNLPTAFAQLPQTSYTGLDFWVLGQGLSAGKVLATGSYTNGTGVAYDAVLQIYGGAVSVASTPHAGGATTYVTCTGSAASGLINNGYWHHVGWFVNGNNLYVYQDGTYALVSALSTNLFISASSPGVGIGEGINGYPSLPAYIDEIVVSGQGGSGYPQPAINEILNRYRAGNLLQLFNQQSGDRIAEILVVAGLGAISAGAITINSNQFYVANAYNTPVVYSPGMTTYAQVEPYYWDSPTTGSTALDLILQICDTDIGIFYQRPDGTLLFIDQNYFGTWAWPAATWTPSYTAPSGDHVWSDDGSSSYAYYGPSFQSIRDDADVWTSVRITPQSGKEQFYENTSAEGRWGYSTLLKSGTVSHSLSDALSAATYLGYLFRSALPRVQSVELRSETANGANMTALLGTKIYDVVSIVRTSPGASTSGTYPSVEGKITGNFAVESISHDFQADPGYLHVSYICDPYPVRS